MSSPTSLHERLTEDAQARLRAVLQEKARRQIESLRLYEPLPEQAKFHRSTVKMRLARGSNRSGKTLIACVEVARAVCGKDPFGKYPKRDGRVFCVGTNLDHVGEVLWRKLGRAGAFKIIRDQATGNWRAYRPWDANDLARKGEAKPAPPLIPPRLVKDVAWENKAKRIPKKVILHTGWEINFYSSEGKPPLGVDLDLVHFDEEIVDPEWYPEMMARLLDRQGRFLWSATPQNATEELFTLHERAAQEERQGAEASVAEFVLLLEDNPHIPAAEKQAFAANLNEEQRRVRVQGEFAINAFRVFPEYSRALHGVEWFQIPPDWCRYAVIDPGRQVCAVLFAAVPPEKDGDFVYLFDELYIAQCSAAKFAERMAEKTHGFAFHAFILDMHEGRKHDASGLTLELQYAEALREQGVKSRVTGHGFLAGNDDVLAGIEAFRDWLRIRIDGPPRLRVLYQGSECALPNLADEIKHYRYQRDAKGFITDKPETRGRVHLMACCRYLALYRPQYHAPVRGKPRLNPLAEYIRQRQQRRLDKEKPWVTRLGPTSRRWGGS